MASGDTLFVLTPQAYTPPGTLYATLDTVVDGSDPVMSIPVLDFDGNSQNEAADWFVTMPSHYSGSGLTFTYKYAMSGSVGHAVKLTFLANDFTDATSVLTADLAIDGQTGKALIDDPSGTQNEFNMTAASTTMLHSEAGSLAAGAYMIIRAWREYNYDAGSGANTDDLQLLAVHVTET